MISRWLDTARFLISPAIHVSIVGFLFFWPTAAEQVIYQHFCRYVGELDTLLKSTSKSESALTPRFMKMSRGVCFSGPYGLGCI